MIMRDNFSYFSLKPYVVTPHLKGLIETVQMRGNKICFYAELTKITPVLKFSLLCRAMGLLSYGECSRELSILYNTCFWQLLNFGNTDR